MTIRINMLQAYRRWEEHACVSRLQEWSVGKRATYGVHRGLVGAVYDELDGGRGDGVMGIEPELERKLLALRSHMRIGWVGAPQGVRGGAGGGHSPRRPCSQALLPRDTMWRSRPHSAAQSLETKNCVNQRSLPYEHLSDMCLPTGAPSLLMSASSFCKRRVETDISSR